MISAVTEIMISTIRYNQVTDFFAKSFIFCNMVFCIEKQFLCKGNFIIKEQSRRVSLYLATSSLVSADSTETFYVILILLGSTFPAILIAVMRSLH